MQVRKPITELKPGDFIVRIGDRPINSSFVALHPVKNNEVVVGPRGGRYSLHQPMASYTGEITSMKVVETRAGKPIVKTTAFATVEAPEEW